MRILFLIITIALLLAMPVSAAGLIAPEVPESGISVMPEETDSFGNGLIEMLRNAFSLLQPDLTEACRVCMGVIAVVILLILVKPFSGSIQSITFIVGAVTISSMLLSSTNSMIRLGSQTVTDICEYGKLLMPVMTAALAAQGGIGTSAALYAGTTFFTGFLGKLISGVFVPLVYLFLALAAANSAVDESVLKNMKDLLKNSMSWCLKTVLTVFTTYISITGVISGTTDAAALKATKVTISSVVPVVGGILSDASEAVLVSAGLAKNAAGIYGIFAILAVFLTPFLQIGIHYLLLKLTAAICGIFGKKRTTDLIADFSTAMGLLLGMTGAACLLLLISTVCFLKGVG